MKCSFLFLLMVTSFLSCNYPKEVKKADDFNKEIYVQYEKDFLSKYKNYNIKAREGFDINDFIAVYAAFCKIGNYKKSDYDIIQSYHIYVEKSNPMRSIYFDYELVYFFKAEKADTLIQEIKEKNCIDAFNLKIHRIYRIGRNTIIIVNYTNFDISDYENFLRDEFDMPISAEIINTSRNYPSNLYD